MKKRIRKRDIFKYTTIPISLVYMALYMYFTEGYGNIKQVFISLNYGFFIVSLLVMTINMFMDVVAQSFMRHKYQKGVPFLYNMHVSLICTYWSSITPPYLSTSMVVQIGFMNDSGLSPGDGTAVMFAQCVANTYTSMVINLILILMSLKYLVGNMNILMWLLFVASFSIQIFTTMLYLFVPKYDKQLLGIISFFIHIGACLQIIKDENRSHEKVDTELKKLKYNVSNFKYTKKDWMIYVIISVIKSIASYSLGWFIAMTIGVNFNFPYYIYLAAGSVASYISGLINFIPGGFGIGEALTYMAHAPIVGNANINYMILFGRIISYYYPFILGVIASLIPVKNFYKKDVQ